MIPLKMTPNDLIFKDILFKEYDTLRAEIISRTSSSYQLLGLWFAGGTWLVFHKQDPLFWRSIGLFSLATFGMMTVIRKDTRDLAKRLRMLEREINELAGRELLKWETHYGGGIFRLFRRASLRRLVP
jgi:hypothetical protein